MCSSLPLSVTLLFSGIYIFSLPHMLRYLCHHDNQKQMRLSAFCHSISQANLLLYTFGGNNPKRDKTTFTVFCTNKQNSHCTISSYGLPVLSYQLMFCLWGLYVEQAEWRNILKGMKRNPTVQMIS